MAPDRLAATLRKIERSAGALATASVARMDETLPWFRALPADQRSWVMLVAQAGVRSLVEWLRADGAEDGSSQELSDEVFAAAPRALAGRPPRPVAVVVGRSPGGDATAVLHMVYRAARRARVEVVGGLHGDRLVVVMGGAADPLATAKQLEPAFGDGPIVVGPAVPS